MGKKINRIDKKTVELFQTYHWSGNVRELQNVVERAVILCEGGTFAVDESWLVVASPRPSPSGDALASLTDREKEMIEKALSESRGRVSGPLGAAARLGIPRSTLESRIKSLNINKYRFRSA
jgi:formate hydrogenlyase transcriptional activator